MPMDAYRHGDDFHIHLDLPGIDPDSISLTVEQNVLNTASKELVNWPARSLIRNLTADARWPRSISKLRAACVARAPSGCAVMPVPRDGLRPAGRTESCARVQGRIIECGAGVSPRHHAYGLEDPLFNR